MIVLLDSSALIAYLKTEPGASVVDSYLSNQINVCAVHAINLCEVYYELLRLTDQVRAKETISRLLVAGLIVREDMDTEFWQEAGNYKATIKRVSLADCFCLALANRLGAEIITADRHEFGPLVEQKICKARFIR